MYIFAISALVISVCCLAALVIRNLGSIFGSFPYPDYTKELDQIDKTLAIVAGLGFLIYIVLQLARS
jgi:hypothetical protein